MQQGHEGDGVRGLRGHIRRQECGGPPQRFQRRQPVPHRPLLQSGAYGEETGPGQESGGDRGVAREARSGRQERSAVKHNLV